MVFDLLAFQEAMSPRVPRSRSHAASFAFAALAAGYDSGRRERRGSVIAAWIAGCASASADLADGLARSGEALAVSHAARWIVANGRRFAGAGERADDRRLRALLPRTHDLALHGRDRALARRPRSAAAQVAAGEIPDFRASRFSLCSGWGTRSTAVAQDRRRQGGLHLELFS